MYLRIKCSQCSVIGLPCYSFSTVYHTCIHTQSGLREKLSALKRKGQTDWLERMDITCATVPQSSSVVGEEGDRENDDVDPNDDFKREMWL